jgi:hypothetical protein
MNSPLGGYELGFGALTWVYENAKLEEDDEFVGECWNCWWA